MAYNCVCIASSMLSSSMDAGSSAPSQACNGSAVNGTVIVPPLPHFDGRKNESPRKHRQKTQQEGPQ